MKIIVYFLLLSLISCSSVETYNRTASFSDFEEGGPYTIKVRTTNDALSYYTYETAFNKFGQFLDVTENEIGSGAIEITFTSQTQSAFVGSTSTIGSANVYGNVWYSGANYANYSATAYGSSTSISSGGTFDWQNSNMLITIKSKEGKRLWGADYSYKGGWEMSGWTVNTPSEAAKLCIERLVKMFSSENNYSDREQVRSKENYPNNTLPASEQKVSKTANKIASQLRAVNSEDKDECEFITSITKGTGGTGDVSKFIETVMNSALTEAAKNGADSYFVVDIDTTSSGASVVLEAFKCE